MNKGPAEIKFITNSNSMPSHYQQKATTAAEKIFQKASKIPFDQPAQYEGLNKQFKEFIERKVFTKQLLQAMRILLSQKVQDQLKQKLVFQATYQNRKATIALLDERVNAICYLIDQIVPLHSDLEDLVIPLHNLFWEDVTYVFSMIKTLLGESSIPEGEVHRLIEMSQRYRTLIDKYGAYYTKFRDQLVQEQAVNLVPLDLYNAQRTLWNGFANFANIEIDLCFIHSVTNQPIQAKQFYENAKVLFEELKQNLPQIIKIAHLNEGDAYQKLHDGPEAKLDWLKNNRMEGVLPLIEQRLNSAHNQIKLSGNQLRTALKRLISEDSVAKVNIEEAIKGLTDQLNVLSSIQGDDSSETFSILLSLELNNTWGYILQLEEASIEQADALLPHIIKILLAWKKLFSLDAKKCVMAKLIAEELETLGRNCIETRLQLSSKIANKKEKPKENLTTTSQITTQHSSTKSKKRKNKKKNPKQEIEGPTDGHMASENPTQAMSVKSLAENKVEDNTSLQSTDNLPQAIESIPQTTENMLLIAENHSEQKSYSREGQEQKLEQTIALLSDLSLADVSEKMDLEHTFEIAKQQEKEYDEENVKKDNIKQLLIAQSTTDLSRETDDPVIASLAVLSIASPDEKMTLDEAKAEVIDKAENPVSDELHKKVILKNTTEFLMPASKESNNNQIHEKIDLNLQPVTMEASEKLTASAPSDVDEKTKMLVNSLDFVPAGFHLPLAPTDKKVHVDQNAKMLLTLLNRAGYWAVIVGGKVRDELLGLSAQDIDILTNCPKSQLSTVLKLPCSESLFVPGLFKIHEMDIVCTERSLEEELKRRDLTINTFIADREGNVYDVLGVIDDLNNPELVMIGDIQKRLQEDPSRILRIISCCNQTGKSIPAAYILAMYNNASLITTIPFGLYLKKVGGLFLRGHALPNHNALRFCKIYPFLLPNTVQWKQFLPFLRLIAKELDSLEQEGRDEFYSSYKILALLMLPALVNQLGSSKSTLSDAIQKISDSFCETYQGVFTNEEKLVFKNATKNALESFYFEYNNYRARILQAQKSKKENNIKNTEQPKNTEQLRTSKQENENVVLNPSISIVFRYQTMKEERCQRTRKRKDVAKRSDKTITSAKEMDKKIAIKNLL